MERYTFWQGDPMPQAWKELYRIALRETDNAKLSQRVADAHHAIVEAIKHMSAPRAGTEQQMLSDALSGLRVLQSECDRKNASSRKSSTPSEPQAATTSMREVTCPSIEEFICPFCATMGVSLLVGKVSFSATMGGEELCERETVPLTALICAKSHLFFVRDSDMASKLGMHSTS
jgi:hypothetical protein